jgi:predicted ATPase
MAGRENRELFHILKHHPAQGIYDGNRINRIAEKIPGIDKIDTEESPDKRLLLRFNDKGFSDPFYAQQMSDGTLKIFAYLLLLEDIQQLA